MSTQTIKFRQDVTARGYQAEQAEDGTWTIYDVPVFSVHKDDRGPGEPIEFDAAWLKRALRKAQVREAEGYLPPLHVRHHGDREKVEGAGRFRLRRVGPYQHGGESVPTIFADLSHIRPEAYERIKRGELPYRSVEIIDVASGEIDSLALLDDEVPYFRYELLRIAHEQPFEATVRKAADAHHLIRCWSAAGAARSYTLLYEEARMSDMTQPPAASPESEAKRTDDPMMKVLMAIAKKLGVEGLEGEGEDEGDEQPEAMRQAAELEPKAAVNPVDLPAPEADASAEQRGQVAGLHAQLAAQQREIDSMKRDGRVAAFAADLERRGYPEEAIKAYRAEVAKHGEQAGAAFARGLAKTGPATPPSTWLGEMPAPAADPAEVAAYAARGPEALERARDLHRSWKATGSDVPLKDFIEANLDPDSYFAATRAAANR